MWGYRVAHRQTDRRRSNVFTLKSRTITHFEHKRSHTVCRTRTCFDLWDGNHTHTVCSVRLWLWLCTDCTAFDPNDEVLELLWMCQSGLLLSGTQKLQHVVFFLHYWRVDSISIHNLEFESNWLSLNWLNRMLNLKDRKLNSKFTELELCIFLTSSNVSNVIHSSNVFKNYFEIEFHFRC